MVCNVSWPDFLYGVLCITCLYYVVVIALCYWRQVSNFLAGKTRLSSVTAGEPVTTGDDANDRDSHDTDARLFSAVHDLLEDLKFLWPAAKAKSFARPELLHALRTVTSKYPQLKNTAFQVAINNQVLLEADEFCSIHLDDDDLNNIWVG